MIDTWITLAEIDVQNSINDSELEANLSIATAGGQTASTVIAAVLADVTSEVRGYCRARNTLGAPGTIPAELKNAAIDIALYRVVKRVSGADAAKARKADNDAALEKLQKVASGDPGAIRISVPVTPSLEVTSAPSPNIGEKHHHGFGYREERGI